MGYEYMDDCIHLKACRRMSKLCKSQLKGATVSRGCNESCSAYFNGDDDEYITVDEALAYARDCVSSVSDADIFDVCASCDIPGQTINEIIEEDEK